MSVLIKGMEMPENCTRCDYIGLNVAIGCPVMSGTNGRATDCPLIALPDHHGRLVDADALEKEGWSLHRDIQVDKNTREYQTKPLRKVSTIEPQRKKGEWIDSHTTCSECGWQMIDDVMESPNIVAFNFCPNCGADMREPEDIPMEYFESGGR